MGWTTATGVPRELFIAMRTTAGFTDMPGDSRRVREQKARARAQLHEATDRDEDRQERRELERAIATEAADAVARRRLSGRGLRRVPRDGGRAPRRRAGAGGAGAAGGGLDGGGRGGRGDARAGARGCRACEGCDGW